MRIHSIDYLRGLMALSILLYHLTAWTVGVPQADTILGKLGIYGVSIFYIVSGMSMYTSYKSTAWTFKSTSSFFVRRFARLAPVYWIAMALVIGLAIITAPVLRIDWPVYIYNFTLTFGIFEPTKYMVTGGWSIGNEVVFYLFFPVLMLTVRNSYAFLAANILLFYFYIYFCFIAINPGADVGAEWDKYINPLNQVLLFSGGMAIAHISMKLKPSMPNRYNAILIAFFATAFCLIPAEGNQISIITGWNRLLFTVIILSLSYFVFNLKTNEKTLIEKALKFLGDVSYPVYLLHGILFIITSKYIFPLLGNITKDARLAFCLFVFAPCVMLISYAIYRLIEIPAIRAAKAVTVMDKRTSIVEVEAGHKAA
ncbi:MULTISPECIES: acyltransferase family protein [Enterobacter]|uniref:acyltransferase family protein n=1 Tax=Enterobacter TaxID=547 RepID=UPI00290C4D97|nr:MULTISPECIES: acyltransferase [Enterobacter]MDU7449770.1 acyltransferase [Enterobacter sp.]MEB8199668.1 acyltransferase [Enterobacter quasimori]HEJ0380952.1 acyltransferase [Enterobacter mori]